MKYFLLFYLLIFQNSLAKEIEPINYFSYPNSNYNQAINQLQNGQKIKFSNGIEFSINQKLGFGDEFVIYSITEYPNYALRLVKDFQKRSEIENYVLAIEKARFVGLPTVEVIDFSEGEWILVKKIISKISLSDYIRKMSYQKIQLIDGESVISITQKLRKLLVNIGFFRNIEDLHEENLVYDLSAKKWLIIDLKNEILGPKEVNDPTALNFMTINYGYISKSVFYVKKNEHQWLADLLSGVLKQVFDLRANQKKYVACESIFL